MPEEQAGGVPAELEAWLSDRASETGRDPEEELARAVATYRLLDDHEERLTEDGAVNGTGPASLDTRLGRVDDRLGELSTRLERHESATESNVADLRERVIQVLQTATSKADADHDHESLDARLGDTEAAVADLESDLETLDQQVDGGFENFEAILEGLADSVDDAEGKLDTLAAAIVDLRRRTAALEAADAQRSAAEDLQTEANREGVGAADCDQCGGSVDLALLDGPRCPHCEAVFTGLNPGRRFFGRATLTVGDRPALEGGAVESTDPEDVFENDE